MGKNRALREILKELERTRDQKEFLRDRRQEELYQRLPRLKEIDLEISKIGLEMAKKALDSNLDSQALIQEVKEKLGRLEDEKKNILKNEKIDERYLEIEYNCNQCQDKGFLQDGSRCSCLNQALIDRAYNMSNMKKSMEVENFDSFDLDVFSDKPEDGQGISPRENMEMIYKIAKAFIRDFDIDNGNNLLFYGPTGLGKTFLSSAIAKELIEDRKIVIYQTAFTMMEILSDHRFRRSSSSINEEDYRQLFQADLLIIDDLGTELSNSFTNSEIFNIVNTRILTGKKTIISTNLSPKEILDIYTDRVFSRVLDKFVPIRFFGKDLRWEK